MAEDQIPSFDQTEPLSAEPDQASAGSAAAPPKFEDTQEVSPSYVGGSYDLSGAEAEKKTAQAGLESALKGFLPFGHTVVAGAEKALTSAGVSGLTPEDQAQREEYLKSVNSFLPAATEAAGFAGSMLTGMGEAKLIGKIGEAGVGIAGLSKVGKALKAAEEMKATGQIGPLAQMPSIGARLQAGAVRAGTELAALQADDEVSKAVNGTSKGVGDAITNIGLSGALGAAGGGLFSGIGMGAKGAMDAMGLADFVDQSAARAVNAHPNEMIEKQFADAHQAMSDMGTEVGGANGVAAQARAQLMPELNPEITGQAEDLISQINKTADQLQKYGDRSGSLGELRAQADQIAEVLNPSTQQPVSPGQIFDTLNQVKRQFGEWADFNKDMVPLSEVGFRNASKNLGFQFKTALENPDVWGKVGDLQKSLNGAWSDSFGALKDARSKFMQKVLGQHVVDPAKFATYLKQNGKITTQSIRQQMMENFVDSVEKFQNATADAYEKAGIPNPHAPVPLGALKESYGQQSPGYKLANLMHDHLTPAALGDLAGAGIGAGVAHALGLSDIAGVYAGKWVGGRILGAVIKPILEKAVNFPAFQASMKFVKQVAQGQQRLVNATNSIFTSGSKTLPQHWLPDVKQLLKLDDHLKKLQGDQASLGNVAGDLPHYLPDHAQMVSKTAMNAVSLLNSQRPVAKKLGPLDTEIPPTKAEQNDFQRKLAIAEQPLMVVQHIKDGTLLPSDVGTLKNLYPEYYEKMSQQIMIAMGDHLHGEGSIPYKIRQGLSLFLAQPLDSTMTPQAIQSIQSTFAQVAPQSQQQGQSKGSASKLGKVASNLQTPGQAREARQNKV